ncbi:helix-turn-helix transcriptional regulator [Mucilaginibacter terrae]|uniref:AraC-like DNA-binding protein n=1 Tax=Mucilaginibacter terrae TaxID=1955052 RepID=A0ABU3GVT1_9SPHI|nr:AraC family transcriptional regulator [Mucilaginibacter terrae]MDT3403874.1 AraC-like DNA-binding protein [Mucilaginibacter terrae]
MNITITSASHEALNLQLKYPREFSGLKQLEERYSHSTATWGNLYINELWFDGACVFQSTIEANKPCRLSMQCDNSCWLMNFLLDGEVITSHGNKSNIMLKAGQYNSLYCSELNIEAGIKQTTRIFSVCLTRRFIKHLFWKSPVFNDGDLANESKTIFVTENQPITQQLKAIISEINKAAQPAYIRRIYLEGKILELLSLQLKNSLLEPVEQPRPATNNDLQKLQAVKQLLEQNIKTPHSLNELAKKSGLNDFKLKKGFKETYGHTVFGYLAELRMQKAQSLLQSGLTVSEVADTVGYKNAHHFTVAFKKRFNLRPSEVGNKN